MARVALTGVLLFAFIPLVLFLFLRQPLGPGLSILVGLAIMFGHRFVARPWMMRHVSERCLWCGRAVSGGGEALRVITGGQTITLAACSSAHAAATSRFLAFVYRWRGPIGVGIFVPLVVLIVGSLALAAGHPVLPQEWNAWQFRTIVAFTVVTTSLAWYGSARPDDQLRAAFPLHNFFLLGIRNTLWVFRIVGAWWLALLTA